MLAKELAFEHVGQAARRRSLGTNARMLETKAPALAPLPGLIRRFADCLYTPAKHDFELPEGRSHRFTSREVVLSVYISVELGDRILKVSPQARAAAKADDWYVMGGRWGSGTRVEYAGP
jgi:hypothetical protein